MQIQIGDIELFVYDKTDEKQRHLRYVLENDKDFTKYVTKDLETRLNEAKDNEGLQYNSSYLVKYKNEFVGYIRFDDLKWNGVLNIEFAVSPEYRNQNLGKKIIVLLTKYLLENKKEIIKLRGIIEKSNYASRKMMENAGYIEEKKDDTYIYVSKSR